MAKVRYRHMCLVGGFPGRAPGGRRPLVSRGAHQRKGRLMGIHKAKLAPPGQS